MAGAGRTIVHPHIHLWDLTRAYYAWPQDDPLPNNPGRCTTSIARLSDGLDDYFADAKGRTVSKVLHVEYGLAKKDHLAETDWLQSLAWQANVAVKTSGFGGVDRAWTIEGIRSFVLSIIEMFGVERAMFTRRFPVDRVHDSFDKNFSAFDAITRDLGAPKRAKLFATTAEDIYRLDRH